MHSGLPRRHRIAIRITLAAAWGLSGCGGLSAILVSPTRIVGELGYLGTLISGAVLFTVTFIAMAGVIWNRYQWEWVASWIAAAALAPYLVTSWALVVTDTWTRSTQAFLITSLVAFYISRAVLCSAHAAKLRELHTASAAVLGAIAEGGSHGDDDLDGHG